ncbi:hypothetical protein QBC46DRAFT_268986 [Diplogelasinospora grovesii]|uniref:rRNA-processing protein FYV7 n=1 Tax=Diplogelasinospora grovesii TaxID=303347 RepID=A0AAN6N2R4_9PEZI|nr:hypothetical protein QBC46DRAFT_268986 [Diplogelasinospora grovesii]
MSGKRPRDDHETAEAGDSKKAKHGFRVGPENLPDGPWRRKVTKIKKDLILKAKVKRQYAKVKATLQKEQPPTSATATATSTAEDGTGNDQGEVKEPEIHPERQAMLHSTPDHTTDLTSARAPAAGRRRERKEEAEVNEDQMDAEDGQQQQRQWKKRRPDYYEKQLAEATRKKAEAEAREAEFKRREEEKKKRMAQRDQYRKQMAKARQPGKDGKRKLGRESQLLLDKAKRIMGA